MVESDMPRDKIIGRNLFACWATKATNAHSEYVIIIASPRQHWFRERSSILREIRKLPVLFCSVLLLVAVDSSLRTSILR
jgi:hypothetical protein